MNANSTFGKYWDIRIFSGILPFLKPDIFVSFATFFLEDSKSFLISFHATEIESS